MLFETINRSKILWDIVNDFIVRAVPVGGIALLGANVLLQCWQVTIWTVVDLKLTKSPHIYLRAISHDEFNIYRLIIATTIYTSPRSQ